MMARGDLVVVILAAGKGTRLRSRLAKVLHRAGGRSLVEHVVRACRGLKPRAIYVVVGHQAHEVSAVAEPLGAETILQVPQRGTGHALLVARSSIGRGAKYALVLPGDAPLVRTETLAALNNVHRTGQAAATILSAHLADPTGYGRILRKQDGRVAAIVEAPALQDDQRDITEVNSSMYCFTLEKLWPCLVKLRPENVHRELYLTDAIALLHEQGETVLAQVVGDAQEILGCNTRAELAEVDLVLRRRKSSALMDAGVTIEQPDTVVIDPDVVVGSDTLIEPCVQLLGKTRIGSSCTIGTGSVLADTTAEDQVTIKQYCVVEGSRLAAGAVVGPFAHLRIGSELRSRARVGNYVEVKQSVLGEGVKAMHLTYLGDAKIGPETNIGAGTITCNYDGTRKHPTRIGKRVFIGSDTALVAPISVGDGAYVAAGSTLTENVPSGALGIARGRQVNKPGWVRTRRREAQAAERRSEQAARKHHHAKPRPKRRLARRPVRKPSRRR